MSSGCPQESVKLVQLLLELMVHMNSSLGQDFAKQSTSLGRMWTMTTITTTIYLHERETDWGWGTLEFQTTPFRGGIALQTSITPLDWPILSGELYPMAEVDMIRRNTSPQTTGTTAHHVRQVPVLCTKCAEPGEVIPPPGLGVEALNQDALPPPRCLHHLAHHHLPTPLRWGVACLPPIKDILP